MTAIREKKKPEILLLPWWKSQWNHHESGNFIWKLTSNSKGFSWRTPSILHLSSSIVLVQLFLEHGPRCKAIIWCGCIGNLFGEDLGNEKKALPLEKPCISKPSTSSGEIMCIINSTSSWTPSHMYISITYNHMFWALSLRLNVATNSCGYFR